MTYPLRFSTLVAAIVMLVLIGYELFVFVGGQWGLPAVPAAVQPYRVGEVAGAGRVSQTFTVWAAGFDGIVIRAEPYGGRADGTVVFELSERDGTNFHPLYRIVRPAAEVVARSSYAIRFPPIERSKGGRYRLDIAMPSAPDGSGLAIWADKENRYREGALFLGGQEQWGDLLFTTSARDATVVRRFGNAVQARLAAAMSPWILGGLFLAFNGAIALFWFELRRRPAAQPLADRADGGSWLTLGGLAIAIVAIVASTQGWGAARDEMMVDLIDRFADAEKQTTRASLHETFDILDVTIKGETERSLFAHPPARIQWTVQVPPNAVLKTAAALQPHVWGREGDGAVFRVGISVGDRYENLFRRSVSPYYFPQDRRWVPITIDLTRYAGQQVRIVFNTEPGEYGNAVNDAAVWAEPRIVRR